MACRCRSNSGFPIYSAIIVVLAMLSGCQAFTQPAGRNIGIGSITLSGNNRTRDFVIYRELEYKAGDTLTEEVFRQKISQSRLNLLNTGLFNFVTVDTVIQPQSEHMRKVDIHISFIERWYIWPVPIMQFSDRNFSAWLNKGDFTRINFGVSLKWNNLTGRLDMLESMLRFGKSQQFSILYTYPYLDKKKRLGVGAEIGYRNNREVGFITRNDKLVYLFQSKGLSTEKYSSVQFTYRRNIFVTHQLIAGYRSFSFDSILADSNDQYSYEGELHPGFLNIYYKLKIDYRDLKYYPLTGWYADVEINKSGFGFEGPVNIGWGKTTLRHFSRLASRWYSGISFIGKLSMAKWQPYFLIQGLGYQRDFVRGYEYNVVDGRHYTLLHSTVKYALLPQQSRDIGFVKTSKFGKIHYAAYLTAFADAGYVWQPQWNGLYNNKLPETLLASAGLGVDFVTYYDKVIRVEYSVNRSGKSGIFINFIAGI